MQGVNKKLQVLIKLHHSRVSSGRHWGGQLNEKTTCRREEFMD